jgi:hypothetical protein
MEDRTCLVENRGGLEGDRVSPTRRARFKRKYVGVRPWMRHSLVLMVAGMVYALIGMSYILAEPTHARQVALQVALDNAPIQFWGFVFIAAGLLSIISSRWPPVAETWGYMVLTGLSAGWSATYFLGVVLMDSPTTNLSGSLSWGLLGFMWWAVSGLVNPGQAVLVVEHWEDEENGRS